MAPSVRMAPVESQASYPVSSAPVGKSQGSVDYLDTPNLAGTGHAARAAPPQTAPGRKLPMIDSDEALAQQNQN